MRVSFGLVAGVRGSVGCRVRRRRQRHTAATEDHSDGDGVAHGERDHLRPDSGVVDTDRRHGVGIGHLSWTTSTTAPGAGTPSEGVSSHLRTRPHTTQWRAPSAW